MWHYCDVINTKKHQLVHIQHNINGKLLSKSFLPVLSKHKCSKIIVESLMTESQEFSLRKTLPLSKHHHYQDNCHQIYGYVQEKRNSIVKTLELCLSCTNPWKCFWDYIDEKRPPVFGTKQAMIHYRKRQWTKKTWPAYMHQDKHKVHQQIHCKFYRASWQIYLSLGNTMQHPDHQNITNRFMEHNVFVGKNMKGVHFKLQLKGAQSSETWNESHHI